MAGYKNCSFFSKCHYNKTRDDNSTDIATMKPHKGFNLFPFAQYISQLNGCYYIQAKLILAKLEE